MDARDMNFPPVFNLQVAISLALKTPANRQPRSLPGKKNTSKQKLDGLWETIID
jgi:hypothetical protein